MSNFKNLHRIISLNFNWTRKNRKCLMFYRCNCGPLSVSYLEHWLCLFFFVHSSEISDCSRNLWLQISHRGQWILCLFYIITQSLTFKFSMFNLPYRQFYWAISFKTIHAGSILILHIWPIGNQELTGRGRMNSSEPSIPYVFLCFCGLLQSVFFFSNSLWPCCVPVHKHNLRIYFIKLSSFSETWYVLLVS